MTQSKITVAEAAATLARINMELDETQQDVALLERLRAAPDRAKRLAAEQAKAKKEHDTALAAEQKARDEARFAGLSNIRVTDRYPDEGITRSSFAISYTRGTSEMDDERVDLTSFRSLPDNVFAFLLERHPERIPAKIMELAPGDPHAAFERYFRALKRGYLAA